MNLTPREKDKLLVSMAAIVARNRLTRGVTLTLGDETLVVRDATSTVLARGAARDGMEIRIER